MEVKHCCADSGKVTVVHVHNSWQEIKNCLRGMQLLCEACRSWPLMPYSEYGGARSRQRRWKLQLALNAKELPNTLALSV